MDYENFMYYDNHGYSILVAWLPIPAMYSVWRSIKYNKTVKCKTRNEISAHNTMHTYPFGTASNLLLADGIQRAGWNFATSTAYSVPWILCTQLKHKHARTTIDEWHVKSCLKLPSMYMYMLTDSFGNTKDIRCDRWQGRESLNASVKPAIVDLFHSSNAGKR